MGKGHTILVAEDDDISQMIAKNLLEGCGYQCKVVSTGSAAVKLASEYDLIFMDLGLSDMSGIEATKKIRSKGITTPIIALTAHGTKKNVKECFQAGMNEFLEKPLSIEAIEKLFYRYVT